MVTPSAELIAAGADIAGQAVQATQGTAQAAIAAIPQMYGAMQEARARIREAELAMAQGIHGSLSGGMGVVLSTIDRPFYNATFPNKGGGTSELSISLQTIVGLVATMDAHNTRQTDPTNWNRLVEAWLDTIDYVPAVVRTGEGAIESVTAESGKKKKSLAGKLFSAAIDPFYYFK
jgi:hypothetical protein